MSEAPSGTGMLVMPVGALIAIYGALLIMASGVSGLIEIGMLSENILVELLYSATSGNQDSGLGIVLLVVGAFIQKVGEEI